MRRTSTAYTSVHKCELVVDSWIQADTRAQDTASSGCSWSPTLSQAVERTARPVALYL